MPAAAGDIGKSNNVDVISVGIAASTTITKGEVVTFDSSGHAITGTTSQNPNITGRGVALETKVGTTAGAIKVRIAIHGEVYVTAGGAIKPNARLEIVGSAGKVGLATAGTAAGVEQNKHLNATYLHKEGEDSGNATDAADTNVILVRLS